jgi:hypothetical protein
MSGTFDIQQNNEQILNDIQYLQQIEQQLFNNLETNTNLTTQQQDEIIQKMNQISNMRINLYQTLSGVNNFFQNALSSSIGTLKEQTTAIAIVESELNHSKKRLEALEIERNNKLRLVEINNYYGDKYSEHSKLMKIIIFTLVPIIVLAILNNKGILPNTIYYILLTIISLIGTFFFWRRFASIIMRDNMNYNEYDWYFNQSKITGPISQGKDPWASSNMPGTCIGQACCSDGEIYNASLNQCINNANTSNVNGTTSSGNIFGNLYSTTENAASGVSSVASNFASNISSTAGNVSNDVSSIFSGNSSVNGFTNMTESFANKVLTKTSGNTKPSYTINANNKIKPSNSTSFIYK